MLNYFKLRYILAKMFYENMVDKSYTAEQAANDCFYKFKEELDKNDIEALTIITTILYKIVRHEEEVLKLFLKEYHTMLEILEKIDLDKYLHKVEKDSFLYYVSEIKRYMEKEQ